MRTKSGYENERCSVSLSVKLFLSYFLGYLFFNFALCESSVLYGFEVMSVRGFLKVIYQDLEV